jgi:hypothetical protein
MFAPYGTRTPTRLPSSHRGSRKKYKVRGTCVHSTDVDVSEVLVALAEPNHHPVQPSCA